MVEEVVLVDQHDNPVGTMEKMEAHKKGLLHRAFSVFLFNSEGEMLLQQRAADKYHSAGLWTNACCSHPRPGETIEAAARRRLIEEMGISAAVQPLFQFVYEASFDNGLREHEYDHVLVGTINGAVPFNPDEVAAVQYASMNELQARLHREPDQFTAWFRLAFPSMQQWWQSHFPNQADKFVTL